MSTESAQTLQSLQRLKIHALCKAAATNNIAELNKLLNEGIDNVNLPYKNGITALHYACKAGNVDAIILLVNNGGNLLDNLCSKKSPYSLLKRENRIKLLTLLEKISLEENGAPIKCLMAHLLEQEFPLPHTLQNIFKLFQSAAEQGDLDSLVQLASCYYQGKGVGQDYKRAAELFQMAANKGSPSGMYNIGVCYDKGHGVEKDIKKAFEFYERSSAQGHMQAQYVLALHLLEGEKNKKNSEQGIKLLKASASKGYIEALFNLGVRYVRGEDVACDLKLASIFLTQASDKGHLEARKLLQSIKEPLFAFNSVEKKIIADKFSQNENNISLKSLMLESEMKLRKAFFDAARKGEVEKLNSLIKEGASLHWKEFDDEDPHSAILPGGTVLHYASEAGHLEMITHLVKLGSNVNEYDDSLWTPLHYAADMGHTQVVHLLIQKGADVIKSGACGGRETAPQNLSVTPIHMAAGLGHVDALIVLCEELFRRKIDIDSLRDIFGETPFDYAYNGRSHDLTKIAPRSQCLKVLIKYGATPIPTKQKKRVSSDSKLRKLHYADRKISETELALRISFFEAACFGNTKKLEELIKQGADVHWRDLEMMNLYSIPNFTKEPGNLIPKGTALHYAAEAGYLETVIFLLEQGIDINVLDESSYTPIYYAVREKQTSVVLHLIQKGADIIEQSNKSDEIFKIQTRPTLIHIVAFSGPADILTILCDALHKKSINIHELRDGSGYTPIDWAKGKHIENSNSNSECLEILLKYGSQPVDKKPEQSSECKSSKIKTF